MMDDLKDYWSDDEVDADFWLVLFALFFGLVLLLMVIVAIGMVAGYIASYFGLTGMMWWAATIVGYLLIGGLIAMLNRIGD